MAEPLTCQELVELVTDYLESRLSVAQRSHCAAHLGACPNCRTYLDQMRRTIRAVGALRAEALSPAQRDDLVALLHGWH